MIDWSKPIDKTDPKVLAEWANDLRRRATEESKTGWCPALSDIEQLCNKADAARIDGDMVNAADALERAAYHWYRLNK